jgi:stage II sporulation protein D
MKACCFIKNMIAIGFLVLFLPYTLLLLFNGRQGIHREETLPDLEYQVLCKMMEQDTAWMEEQTLQLLAILNRTECARQQENSGEETDVSTSLTGWEEAQYEQIYQAVCATRGQVITIDGELRELPYHMVSAGQTRPGSLLGEEYAYVKSVECPEDLESEDFLTICYLNEQEIDEVFGSAFSMENIRLERDEADYVIRVINADTGANFTGAEVRTKLHLSSGCFWVEPMDGRIRIIVKGVGHGFGISLYTADRMLQNGAEVIEIIQKFYENAECITIP